MLRVLTDKIFESAADAEAHNEPLSKQHNSYEPQSGDVICVGAVKTGTTWLQQIVHQIRTKGDESFRDIYDVTWFIPWPYYPWEFDYTKPQPGAPPRVFKTHDIYDQLPKCEGQKYIFITRDLFDAAYSWMKFSAGWCQVPVEYLPPAVFKEQYESLASKRGGCWSDVILSWWRHRNDPNVLWVHYEDLKADLPQCIKKIAKFLETTINDKELEIILKFCSMEYMTEHKDKFKADLVMETMAKSYNLQQWSIEMGMVRPGGGQVGEGKKLPAEIRSILEEEWKTHVEKELGFSSYEELFAVSSLLKQT